MPVYNKLVRDRIPEIGPASPARQGRRGETKGEDHRAAPERRGSCAPRCSSKTAVAGAGRRRRSLGNSDRREGRYGGRIKRWL